jgi:hypothetical protein
VEEDEAMSTKTRVELIHQALKNLGILVPGQSPSAEDIEKIDSIIEPTLDKLSALETVYVGDPGTPSPPTGGEYEGAHFMPIAAYLAYESCPMFNMAGDAALKVEALRAVEELEVLGRPPRTRRSLRCDAGVRSPHFAGFGSFTKGT